MKSVLFNTLYFVFPLIVFITVVDFILDDIRVLYGVVILIGSLIVAVLLRNFFRNKHDIKKGWRVGHVGRDEMYYDELRDGKWQRIHLNGEMLVGRTHHVIYFGTTAFPDWAKDRRDEIIQRIKSEFRTPDYEYDDAR